MLEGRFSLDEVVRREPEVLSWMALDMRGHTLVVVSRIRVDWAQGDLAEAGSLLAGLRGEDAGVLWSRIDDEAIWVAQVVEEEDAAGSVRIPDLPEALWLVVPHPSRPRTPPSNAEWLQRRVMSKAMVGLVTLGVVSLGVLLDLIIENRNTQAAMAEEKVFEPATWRPLSDGLLGVTLGSSPDQVRAKRIELSESWSGMARLGGQESECTWRFGEDEGLSQIECSVRGGQRARRALLSTLGESFGPPPSFEARDSARVWSWADSTGSLALEERDGEGLVLRMVATRETP